MAIRKMLCNICPRFLWQGAGSLKRRLQRADRPQVVRDMGGCDIDLYWDRQFAAVLKSWGETTVWKEIVWLLAGCSGPVLDVACGTGEAIKRLSHLSNLEVHGCDISDLLIGQAIQAGIPSERLTICDATRLPYSDAAFAHTYSIGSLEHFPPDALRKCIAECSRVSRSISFHMVPVSRSARDEGWMKTVQTFHNNSVEWWRKQLLANYSAVDVVDSQWMDDISWGKWFICRK